MRDKSAGQMLRTLILQTKEEGQGTACGGADGGNSAEMGHQFTRGEKKKGDVKPECMGRWREKGARKENMHEGRIPTLFEQGRRGRKRPGGAKDEKG